jgi:hypothetical protein
VSEQVVLHDAVGLREGTTLYTRWGYGPAVAIALAGLAVGWALTRRRPAAGADVEGETTGAEPVATPAAPTGPAAGASASASDLDDERDRAVVDEGDAHVGAEAAGRDLSTETS